MDLSFFKPKHDSEKITKCELPIRMVFDSKSLFEVLTETTTTTEKRLMIDLGTMKDATGSFEVSDFALIRYEFKIADALINERTIFNMLDTNKSIEIDHPLAQSIIITKVDEVSVEKSEAVWIFFQNHSCQVNDMGRFIYIYLHNYRSS